MSQEQSKSIIEKLEERCRHFVGDYGEVPITNGVIKIHNGKIAEVDIQLPNGCLVKVR